MLGVVLWIGNETGYCRRDSVCVGKLHNTYKWNVYFPEKKTLFSFLVLVIFSQLQTHTSTLVLEPLCTPIANKSRDWVIMSKNCWGSNFVINLESRSAAWSGGDWTWYWQLSTVSCKKQWKCRATRSLRVFLLMLVIVSLVLFKVRSC